MNMYDQYATNGGSMYDTIQYATHGYGGYDDFSRTKQPSSPSTDEIKLRGLNLQDQAGNYVDHKRLNKVSF
jgi:hypothetical protein